MSVIQLIRRFIWDDAPSAQRARRIAKLLLLFPLFVGLFWIIPIERVIQALTSADPRYLVIGMLIGFIGTALTAAEVEPLTRNQGIRHSMGQILAINLAVKFYAQFAPTALVGSGYRWYRFSQPGGKVAESLAAMAFFRLLETFLTVTTGLTFWLLAGRSDVSANVTVLLAVIGAIVMAWVLITRFSLPMYTWFKARGGRFLERPLWRPAARRFEKFLTAVSAYAAMPTGDLVLAVGSGLASVLCGILSGLVLAWAVGIDIGYLEMGWIQAVILIATQLPFAVAGGVGLREVTLVALLAIYAVPADQALAFSFLLFVRGILIGLVGGLIEAVGVLRRRSDSQANGVNKNLDGVKETATAPKK